MPSNPLLFCCPFFSCSQSFPASGSFPGRQLFASGGQSGGASASVLLMNIQNTTSDYLNILLLQRTCRGHKICEMVLLHTECPCEQKRRWLQNQILIKPLIKDAGYYRARRHSSGEQRGEECNPTQVQNISSRLLWFCWVHLLIPSVPGPIWSPSNMVISLRGWH